MFVVVFSGHAAQVGKRASPRDGGHRGQAGVYKQGKQGYPWNLHHPWCPGRSGGPGEVNVMLFLSQRDLA